MFLICPKESEMAKNTGDDYRKGAVTARTQFQHQNGDWTPRNTLISNEESRVMMAVGARGVRVLAF
jgi:hypothetical protein